MNRTIFLLMLLVAPAALFARSIEGRVAAGGERLAGVVVTDGFGFATTDRSGRFTLAADDRAEFVYIVTPAGYVAPFDGGAPVFYRAIDERTKRCDFELRRFDNQNDYTMLAVSDPQTVDDNQFARYEAQTVADIRRYAATIAGAKMAIQLGDITWDNLPLLEANKKLMAGLGFPVYSVMGNHDYDENKSGDDDSAWAYRKQFGPEYYAFDSGRDHYIVLDDIIYDTGRKYAEGIDERQIDWLRRYLQHIPAGEHLVVCVHAPFSLFDGGELRFIRGAERALELMKDYSVDILCGHTHAGSRRQITPWAMEINLGAACGAWWTADTNKCGTPNGYGVIRSRGGDFSWYYKSVGRAADYQIETYGRGVFPDHSASVVAKVWGWDEKWSVTWSEDGRDRGPMTQFEAYDVDYFNYLTNQSAKGKPQAPDYKQLTMRNFYFSATPSKDARTVEITATDRFGNRYKRTIDL